jgi:hypothetical protein
MLYSILIHVSSQNFFEIDLIFMHACPDLRAVDNRRFLQLFMIQNRLTLNSIACFQCKRVHYCMPDKVSYWYDVIWDSFIQYSWGLSSNMKTKPNRAALIFKFSFTVLARLQYGFQMSSTYPCEKARLPSC